MKCKFCQEEMIPSENYFGQHYDQIKCRKCKVDFRFWDNDITNMFFYMNGNSIGIDFKEETTKLWGIKNDGTYQLILSLKYIADVNPTNFKGWLERLLKLKAFS